MNRENDDWVEDLLKGLPKAAPMSEIEMHKFKKLIETQTAEHEKSMRRSSFKVPASVAASIAMVFGAVLLISNHEGPTNTSSVITQTTIPRPSQQSSQNKDEGNSPIATSPSKPPASQSNSQSSTEAGQVYGNSNPSNQKDGTVPKFETNLDYATQLLQIKKLVILSDKPGSLEFLDNSQRQCAIKQAVAKTLLAFDKGYLDGQRVSVYYSGANKNESKALLVDADCVLIKEL